jgi:hypothetical protein
MPYNPVTLCRDLRSLFGILFTYITSAIIILVSFTLVPIVGYLQKRRKYKEYASLEWTTNATLQLHRLAQEELNLGTWSGCINKIPVTEAGEILGSLDIRDLKHPTLALPAGTTAEQESKLEGSAHDHSTRGNHTALDEIHESARASTSLQGSEDHVSDNVPAPRDYCGDDAAPTITQRQTFDCNLTGSLIGPNCSDGHY